MLRQTDVSFCNIEIWVIMPRIFTSEKSSGKFIFELRLTEKKLNKKEEKERERDSTLKSYEYKCFEYLVRWNFPASHRQRKKEEF